MTHPMSSLAAWSRSLGRFGPAVVSGLVVLTITGGIALAAQNAAPASNSKGCTDRTFANHRGATQGACSKNQQTTGLNQGSSPAAPQKAGSANTGSHPGPGGPPGRNVASWAVVNADGTLARGEGVVSSARLAAGSGAYQVIFAYDMTPCAYIATIGISATFGQSAPGEIDVARRFNNADGVFVATHDSAGNAADRGFHLLVIC